MAFLVTAAPGTTSDSEELCSLSLGFEPDHFFKE